MSVDLGSDTLAWILDPTGPEEFLSTYLGRRFVVCRNGNPDRFRELLSLEQLDTVLGTYGLRFPDIRLVRSDTDVPAAEYTWKDNVIDPMRVARLLAEGATVVFGALQDRHEAIRRLCARLAIQASARTQANIYLTPPGSQGFKAHWDTHDVFVMQIEGSKQWRIYEGGRSLPMTGQKFDPDRHEPGTVTAEFLLEAGSVLYIPRGVMHAAVATDQVSVHITLGMMAYTWSELLVDCVTELTERSPEWRENLPFGFGANGDGAALQSQLRNRLQALAESADLTSVISSRVQLVGASHRPRVADHLRQVLDAGSVTARDVIEKRADMPSRLEARGDRVVVLSGERELTFPATAQRTLASVLRDGAVPVSDIDDDLDWAGRKAVISALIREGIVANLGEVEYQK